MVGEESPDGGGEGEWRKGGVGKDIQWWGKKVLMGEGKGVGEGRGVRGYPVVRKRVMMGEGRGGEWKGGQGSGVEWSGGREGERDGRG